MAKEASGLYIPWNNKRAEVFMVVENTGWARYEVRSSSERALSVLIREPPINLAAAAKTRTLMFLWKWQVVWRLMLMLKARMGAPGS
jgi:hypothetical protein